VNRPAEQQNAVLDTAREALVTVLDEYLGVP
jgi:hypothetical protein